MIHLDREYWEIADEIFRFYLPKAKVQVFGSRATARRLRPQSDIDFLIDNGERMPLRLKSKVRDAFSLSDLPMRVDLVDLHDTDPAFIDSIRDQLVPWKDDVEA